MGENKKSIINEIHTQLESVVRLVEKLEENDKKPQESNISPTVNSEEPNLAFPGELAFRVIHLNNNPHEVQMKEKQKEFDRLKKENGILKARLELLESGNDADITQRISDAVNKTDQIKILTNRVEELKKREEKILVSFRKTSREFREVVYLLTGYRVDALKNSIYRLSNMYAESEEDKLLFEISPDGTIQLLRNGYSDCLSEYITTYLENANSFPAFLASITMDLFKSSTQVPNNMSISMSTTILPNPSSRSR